MYESLQSVIYVADDTLVASDINKVKLFVNHSSTMNFKPLTLLRVPGVNFDPRGAKHVTIF